MLGLKGIFIEFKLIWKTYITEKKFGLSKFMSSIEENKSQKTMLLYTL